MDSITEKRCSACGEVKPIDQFPKNKNRSFGVGPYCKQCKNQKERTRKHNNPEREHEKRLAWNLANHEKKLESGRKWQSKNIERHRASGRKRISENKEKHNEKGRKWKSDNPEKRKASDKKWKAKNKYKLRQYDHKRRSWKKESGGVITAKQEKELFEFYNYTCLCCGRKEPEIKITLDHVIPLFVGGLNIIENSQPLCLSCNSRKHTKTIDYRPNFEK